MSSAAMTMVLPSVIEGLSKDELVTLGQLVEVWENKFSRNDLRSRYYEGRNFLKDLGVAIPPSLSSTETVVGWPAKAVDELAARSTFDGIMGGTADDDPFDLRALINANRFQSLYRSAVRSQLIHSVAFWTVSVGDSERGEPPVVVAVRSAENAAAIWDTRLKRVKCGIAVTETETVPYVGITPSEVTLYLDHATVTLVRNGSAWLVADRVDHDFGRPMIEAMPFRPSEMRPFGHSRINREVMSLTDSGQRAALRAEVLMEFNTAPQKYLLGASEDAFGESKWAAYLDEILAITKDEDGDTPTFGQFSQLSPQGAIQYFQHLAERFASATSLPVQSLGVITDNPSSAQAMGMAERGLVSVADEMNTENGGAIGNVARMMIAVRDDIGWADLPDEAWQLKAQFLNPANPNIVTQADAMAKMIAAIPWLADTTVALQEFGLTDGQIVRLMAEKRRAEGGSLLDRLAALAPNDRTGIDDLGQTAE